MGEEAQEQQTEEDIDDDEEVLKRIAAAMKDSSGYQEEKQSVYKFLHAVATSDDTTKTGYLRDDKDLNEIGVPRNPIRTYKSLALISDKIMGNNYFKDYFNTEAEIVTATSLSRGGFLVNRAVMQRREIADVTKKLRKENKSWFKKKEGKSTDEALD